MITPEDERRWILEREPGRQKAEAFNRRVMALPTRSRLAFWKEVNNRGLKGEECERLLDSYEGSE